MKLFLTSLSLALGVALYWPLFARILRRRSTTDFSKSAQAMILCVQLVNLSLAILENAWYLAALYAFHVSACAVAVWLVFKFHGTSR